MTLDDIKPDVTLALTKHHERLFKVAGCDPACHACDVEINIGDQYKLATYKERDVMLCNGCTVADLVRKARNKQRRAKRWHERNPGFSRPTQRHV